jgi:hypothetical protein
VQRNGIYFINFLCLSVLSKFKDKKKSAFHHQSGKTEAEPDLIFGIGTRSETGILKINLFWEKSLEPGVSWRLIRSSPLVPDWVTHDWNGTELGRFQNQNHSLIFFQEWDLGLHIFVEVEVPVWMV